MSGLLSQVGYGAESTYGTRVVPARFLEFTEEDVSLELEQLDSAGLRAGQTVLRSDRQATIRMGAAGSITHEFARLGMGLLLLHALGAVAITTPAGATLTRRHTYTPGSLVGKFLTTQIGRPDTGGVVRPFDYVGCKVATFEINQSVGEYLTYTHELDAQDELTNQTLAVASYPWPNAIFHWGQCAVTVGGSDIDDVEFSLSGDNGLKRDRRFLRGSALKKEPIRQAMTGCEGTASGEVASFANYTSFVAGGAILPIVATWTSAALIEAGFPFKLTITLAACRAKGNTPNVGGPDVLEHEIEFDVLDDGVSPPVSIVLDTTDAVS